MFVLIVGNKSISNWSTCFRWLIVCEKNPVQIFSKSVSLLLLVTPFHWYIAKYTRRQYFKIIVSLFWSMTVFCTVSFFMLANGTNFFCVIYGLKYLLKLFKRYKKAWSLTATLFFFNHFIILFLSRECCDLCNLNSGSKLFHSMLGKKLFKMKLYILEIESGFLHIIINVLNCFP